MIRTFVHCTEIHEEQLDERFSAELKENVINQSILYIFTVDIYIINK